MRPSQAVAGRLAAFVAPRVLERIVAEEVVGLLVAPERMVAGEVVGLFVGRVIRSVFARWVAAQVCAQVMAEPQAEEQVETHGTVGIVSQGFLNHC